MKRLSLPLMIFAAGCTASTDQTVTSTADALTTAQCTFEGFDDAAKACFDTFATCRAAAGAVEADCKTALDACLPPPPAGSHAGHGGPGEGHCGGGHGGPDGGVRPPRGPGGPGGPGGHGGPHGGGGRPPPIAIDSAELTACRDAYAACVAADASAEASCRGTERDCSRAVFRAAFEATCAEAAAACGLAGADAEACARITARCAEGVDGRPKGADAGTCDPAAAVE